MQRKGCDCISNSKLCDKLSELSFPSPAPRSVRLSQQLSNTWEITLDRKLQLEPESEGRREAEEQKQLLDYANGSH